MMFVACVPLVLVAVSAACMPTPTVSPPMNSPPPTAPPSVTSSEAQSASAPSAPPTPTEVLAKDRAIFDACYARARAANPDLGRTSVDITFTIDAEGKPTLVELQYHRRLDEAAKECLRDAALKLQFPPSLAGKRSGTITFTPPAP
jgi:outer membrane biosynthesis protein TonB